MAETWQGIYPITSFVLRALERHAPEHDSGRERVLRVATAFWAAAAAGRLPTHVAADPTRELDCARAAFAALGAVRSASLIRAARESLVEACPPARLRAVLERLDDQLARTDDNIDELVARYAGEDTRQVHLASAS